MEFHFNDKALCHEECKHVEACSGYTYEDDSQRCFLSSDTMFIDTSPCFSCRFYEKTCQSCMYSLYIYIIISWFVFSLINIKIRKTSKQNPFVNVKRMPCFYIRKDTSPTCYHTHTNILLINNNDIILINEIWKKNFSGAAIQLDYLSL